MLLFPLRPRTSFSHQFARMLQCYENCGVVYVPHYIIRRRTRSFKSAVYR